MNVFEEWLAKVCAELGVPRADVDRDLVLELTKDVAHLVARPAAPVTAYIVGLAARGDPQRAGAATQRVRELAAEWHQQHGRPDGDA